MPFFLGCVGSALGGTIGWHLGAGVGLMTAYLLGTVTAGVGFYYGRRLGASLVE